MTASNRGPVDPRLLRHSRTSRTGVLLLTLLGIGQAVATITVILALSRMVVVLFDRADGRAGSGLPIGDLGLLAGGFVGRAVLTWAEQVVAQRTAAGVAQELRAAVLTAALRRGPAWVGGFGTGRLAALLIGGMDALRPWFAGYLPSLVLAVVLPPLVVVVMAVVDPASALIAVLTLPLIPVFGALVGRATERRAQERWEASARLSGHFLDVVRGLAALRLYGRAERQVAVVRQMTERHRAATVRVLRIAFLSSTALDLVATLSVGLIAVEAGLRVAAGRLDLGPALLVILLAPEAYRPLREVGARFHAGADASAVITEVDAVLTDPEPAGLGLTPGSTRAGASEAFSANGFDGPAVRATGLRVRHSGARMDALDLPALRLHGGDFVALRGPSGAGKTTTLRVLAGLQAPVAGSVEVTGPRPLYLPQRPTLPHARTVADALILDDDSELADDVVLSALTAVGLAAEVAAMPGGVRAPLGEYGRGLSSGQRQRLALARVLRAARIRPTVLLLDEPTAHLDPAAEHLVIEELRAAARRGCTVLVVAHRPTLLAAVDRIVEVAPPRLEAHFEAQHENFVGHAPTEASRSRSAAPTAPAAPGGSGGEVEAGGRGGLLGRVGRSSAAAIGLGAGAWLAGVTLTGAAAWLLVRAASLPPVLTLSAAVVTVRASAVARPLLRYLERLTSHEVGFARLGRWRAGVYADLVPRMPGAGLHRRGELLSRIVEDVDTRVDGLLRGRLPASSAVLALVTAILAALVLLPVTALALGPGLLIAAVLAPALAARRATQQDATTAQARAELADAVLETVEGMDELAGRGAEVGLRIPIRRGRALARIEARAARSAGAATALAHLGLGLAVIGTALAVASAIGAGQLGAGGIAAGATGAGGISAELAAVLLLGVVTLAEPVLALPDAAIARRRGAGAVTRLAALRALPRSVAELHPANPGPSTETITIRGLVAGWDPARPPALNGLDLELPAGSRVAVLGPSGSGKSTLAAVLTRLLDPTAGSLDWRHRDSDSRDSDSRDGGCGMDGGGRVGGGRVAMVGDDVDHVFASTLRENLRLSRPGATDDDLRAALTDVRLGGWLSGLPRGLDTWLGEGGTTMSGGERRRLVTARALLADPDLLVLDEPTEGLDEPTAQALMTDLLRATQGRRVLLLTHRREGLDQVDAVHELVAGRLRSLSAAA